MQTILIISFSDLKNDPRIQRQIAFLKAQYHIIAVGLTDPEVPGVRYIPCTLGNRTLPIQAIKGLLLVLKHYDLFYWFPGGVTQVIRQLYDIHADLILANDIQTVPLALKLANMHGAKVIFDAHEYFPKQFEHRLWWRRIVGPYLAHLCLTYIPQVDGMITVGQAIAEQYEHDTGVKPVVMTNAPFYQNIQPCLRSHDEQRIRLIHHGYAQRSRKIENMIAVMGYLDERFELDFLLVPSPSSPGYIEELQQQAQNNPRIRFLPPVSMQELVGFSNQYDVGLYLLEPVNFNHRYAVPNKFFEFIQARLAVGIGPTIEMARLVQEYQCGIVANDFSPRSLAQVLMQLDHTAINAYKQQSHKAAQQLSAEQNRGILLDLVGRLLA